MASQDGPYPLASIGVDPITSVASLPDRPPPQPPKPVADKSAPQKFFDRLLGIEGEKRYKLWPERLGRDIVSGVAHGLRQGADLVHATETGQYGQPGTHEFTEAITSDAFHVASDNFYPAEWFGAVHKSGDILTERIPPWFSSLAPMKNTSEFVSKMLGGMAPRSLTTRFDKNGAYINGNLVGDGGKYLGHINRQIDLKKKTAYHQSLELMPDAQGKGLAKEILANQIELYQKIGLDRVSLTAGLDRGGYAWAKYGFLPTPGYWASLRGDLQRSLMQLSNHGKITKQQFDAVQPLLQSEDPHSMWAISDVTSPTADGRPLGKQLLSGTGWSGQLNLKDKDSMERFNAYVAKRPQ